MHIKQKLNYTVIPALLTKAIIIVPILTKKNTFPYLYTFIGSIIPELTKSEPAQNARAYMKKTTECENANTPP